MSQLVADHVDPARSRAYEQLGETVRAMELAVSWLRPKLEADAVAYPPGRASSEHRQAIK